MSDLIEYYNKFNEDKRLQSRHGKVEFNTTINYILKYLKIDAGTRLIDIGAGTGAYSIYLAKKGVNVTAVELVKYNLGILKKKAKMELSDNDILSAYNMDARSLKKFEDESFDATLLLGPMYHLHTMEDKLKALNEAKRVTKKGGYIFVAYVMADYALVRHGFMDHNILESVSKGALADDYKIKSDPNELYDYIRLEDINKLNELASLKRELIISPDGPSDYIRHILNEMSEEEFLLFMDYQLKNAHRSELIGAGSHTVDILYKE